MTNDDGTLRRYFTTIPNMILDDERVCPLGLALYAYYKRVAGDAGKCIKRRDTISRETGISKSRWLECRKRLVELGYLTVEEREGETTIVRIVDVWNANMQQYAGVREADGGVRDVDGGRPPDGPKEKPLEEQPLEESLSLRADIEPELTDDQRVMLRKLHAAIQRDVYGGTDAPRTGWGAEYARRGMTESDIAAAVEAMKPTAAARPRSLRYGERVLERRVEERESGHDPDERGRGTANVRGVGVRQAVRGSRVRGTDPSRGAPLSGAPLVAHIYGEDDEPAPPPP